jgi:hypothetical protein
LIVCPNLSRIAAAEQQLRKERTVTSYYRIEKKRKDEEVKSQE